MSLSCHRLLLLAAAVALSACATTGATGPEIPADAVESTRTESNGDVISEYRVAGQLRVVRVTPARGPVYYLIDSNGDGRLDSSKGEGPVSPVYYKLFEWD
ncbi:MAG: DUF2782 domain-containing protein [Gammaproteobacteria bacterium]|nr:DUF2782 domain-containing protein [Gammaproteobacteria bacterium]